MKDVRVVLVCWKEKLLVQSNILQIQWRFGSGYQSSTTSGIMVNADMSVVFICNEAIVHGYITHTNIYIYT